MSTIERKRKDVQFNFRTALENKEKVERAARIAKQTLTEFAETAVIERAESTLARHESILLSDQDFDRFVELMSAETAPTKKARREAKEFSQGRMEGGRYHW